MEVIEKPSTELTTVQDRAALALTSSKTRQDLLAMSTKYSAITEIKNKAGRDECHSAAMALASARIAIGKTGKAARDDATKFSKAIIQEEASLIAITQPEETRLLALRDGWDTVVAAEKAAKEAAEAARIAGIVIRIATIKEYVALAASCRTAARVDQLLTKLHAIPLTDFEEFSDEAATAHLDTMERVIAIFDEKMAQEAEQARIKAEQAEAAAKLAAERAEFDATQAAAKAEFEAQVAQAKRLTEQAKAEANRLAEAYKAEADRAAAEQARIAKEARDAAIVEADRLAVERQELADERAELKAAQEKLAAQAEQARIDALPKVEVFVPAIEQPLALVQQETPAIEIVAVACSSQPTLTPADANVMWTAICAVAKKYDMTTEQATARLAAIQWTI